MLHLADIVTEQYLSPTLNFFRYEFLFEPDEEGKEQKLAVSNIFKARSYLEKRAQLIRTQVRFRSIKMIRSMMAIVMTMMMIMMTMIRQ